MLCFLKGLGIIIAVLVGAGVVFGAIIMLLTYLDSLDVDWWDKAKDVAVIIFFVFIAIVFLFDIYTISLILGGCPPPWIDV